MKSALPGSQPVSRASASSPPVSQAPPSTPPAPSTSPTFMRRRCPLGRGAKRADGAHVHSPIPVTVDRAKCAPLRRLSLSGSRYTSFRQGGVTPASCGR